MVGFEKWFDVVGCRMGWRGGSDMGGVRLWSGECQLSNGTIYDLVRALFGVLDHECFL